MDLHTAIHSRRTIHTYVDGPVPEEVLQRALQAAHMAPCHRLTWPWRFIVLGSQTREALIPIAIAEKERKAPVAEAQRAGMARSFRIPGLLLAVTSDLDPKPDTARENYAATACAIQNLMLSMTADGFGSKWTTGGVTRAEATYALLGVDPAAAEIVGFVWAGLPAVVPEIRRPPVKDHVRRLA